MSDTPPATPDDAVLRELAERVKAWGREFGFQGVGITDVDLAEHEADLMRWLDDGFHG